MPAASLIELVNRSRSRKAQSASLIAAHLGELVVAVTERRDAGRVVTRTLKLSGKWRINGRNEISFWLSKPEDKKSVVHFGSSWRVNDANEIELSLGRERAVLGGRWDLPSGHSLVYQFGRNRQERFNFRGAFQTHSVLAKTGRLRYQIGVEAVGKKRTRTLTLFGKWVVSRDFGLLFEIEYADGVKRAIRFGAELHPTKNGTVRGELITRAGKPLGFELVLTQDIFGGSGEAFVRLKRTLEESRAEAGAAVEW